MSNEINLGRDKELSQSKEAEELEKKESQYGYVPAEDSMKTPIITIKLTDYRHPADTYNIPIFNLQRKEHLNIVLERIGRRRSRFNSV